MTTQNDGELEDGEVVSDQEESLNSGNKDTLNKVTLFFVHLM